MNWEKSSVSMTTLYPTVDPSL